MKERESSNLIRLIKAKFEDYISITKRIPPEIVSTVDSLDDLSRLIDTITGHLPIENSKKQEILETINLKNRSEKVLTFIVIALILSYVAKNLLGKSVSKGSSSSSATTSGTTTSSSTSISTICSSGYGLLCRSPGQGIQHTRWFKYAYSRGFLF